MLTTFLTHYVFVNKKKNHVIQSYRNNRQTFITTCVRFYSAVCEKKADLGMNYALKGGLLQKKRKKFHLPHSVIV